MLTETQVAIYINAYNVRLDRGEKLEEIDNLFMETRGLTKEDINTIHSFLWIKTED